MIRQGDIVIVPFPYSDLSRRKFRPALVISNDQFNKSADIIALAISSVSSERCSVEIGLGDFSEGTLTKVSFVHCHKIHQLERTLVKEVVAVVKPEILQKVRQEIESYVSP